MLHMILILMVLGLFVHDAEMAGDEFARLDWQVWLMYSAGLKLGLMGWLTWVTRRCLDSFGTPRAVRALKWHDKYLLIYSFLALLLYGFDLAVGGLLYMRWWLGDWVLFDELMLILPTLGVLAAAWAIHFPIEKRLRESSIMATLDDDRPIYPVPTRRQYVLNQLRHQVALVLVPLLLILGWTECLFLYAPASMSSLMFFGLQFAGAIAIYLLAPLMIRYLWDTASLPAGEVRATLQQMCDEQQIRVSDLVVWRTGGSLINAAVIGMFGRLRYIMLSDALLDSVPREEVEAIMAHELGHVRRHHMIWMVLAAISLLGSLQILFGLLLHGLDRLDLLMGYTPSLMISMLPAIAVWALLFGYLSRRIERQADTFAVQTLTQRSGSETVTHEAASMMASALQRVADLNHIPVSKPSWRHGSIAFRQNYLRQLVGQPIDGLTIDRQLRWMNWAIAVLFSGLMTLQVILLME